MAATSLRNHLAESALLAIAITTTICSNHHNPCNTRLDVTSLNDTELHEHSPTLDVHRMRDLHTCVPLPRAPFSSSVLIQLLIRRRHLHRSNRSYRHLGSAKFCALTCQSPLTKAHRGVNIVFRKQAPALSDHQGRIKLKAVSRALRDITYCKSQHLVKLKEIHKP